MPDLVCDAHRQLHISGMEDSKAEASLVTLEQSLEPNFKPPKPFDGLIKGKSLSPVAAGPLKMSL